MERARRFERADAKPQMLIQSTFNAPRYAYNTISLQAAVFDRKAGLGTIPGELASIVNEPVMLSNEEADPARNDAEQILIEESPVTIKSVAQQFTPLETLSEQRRTVKPVEADYVPRGSPRPYISGARGYSSVTAGGQEKSIAPIRAVNSTGNLDDRINCAKLTACTGHISLSSELVLLAII